MGCFFRGLGGYFKSLYRRRFRLSGSRGWHGGFHRHIVHILIVDPTFEPEVVFLRRNPKPVILLFKYLNLGTLLQAGQNGSLKAGCLPELYIRGNGSGLERFGGNAETQQQDTYEA